MCWFFFFFSSSKGYEQGYKWFCGATLSSLGILNSLNTNARAHYINYMACSVCATNYGAWFTMSCGTRGIGAAGPRSPADITVLSLLSWFPWRPAWAWPISQIAAGAQLRSDRLGNVKKKQQKTTAERSRGVRSFDRPYDFWMPASCSRPSPLDNFSSGMSGDSVAGDRLRGSGSSESWLGGRKEIVTGKQQEGAAVLSPTAAFAPGWTWPTPSTQPGAQHQPLAI